jgi:hypothetical protein
MTQPTLPDLAAGIAQATGAVNYLSLCLLLTADVCRLPGVSPDKAEAFRWVALRTLARLQLCMDELGDFLNARDAVTTADKKALAAAFDRVRFLLRRERRETT